MAGPTDPRLEADALLARALQIVVDADESHEHPIRDYTADELDELFFVLLSAMAKLSKVPGGREARERTYQRLQDELERRKVEKKLVGTGYCSVPIYDSNGMGCAPCANSLPCPVHRDR